MGSVHDVDDEIRLPHLFQGRAESLHQLGRQVSHESDGVRQRVLAPVGRARPAHGGVQGRKERILDEHARIRQPVEQRRFPRVGVPGDGHRGYRSPATRLTLRAPRRLHPGDIRFQLRHARADTTPIQLDLRFAGSA